MSADATFAFDDDIAYTTRPASAWDVGAFEYLAGTSSSVSPSASPSVSPSDSPSVSWSASPSGSLSPSASPSPSVAPQDAICWGYATPAAGQEAVTWKRWKLDASTYITVIGDADWGKAEIASGTPAYSPVTDTGDSNSKVFTVTPNVYGTGSGTATISIRGSTTSFDAFDGSPSWATYTTPTTQTWRYVQVKLEA